MKNEISRRLSLLRQWMERQGVDAIIVPTSDPHQSEYTAAHWKAREYISGFNGSAGTAVVTKNGAAIWTDSRYFIAAAQQLEGTDFVLMKEKMEGTPTAAQWLDKQLEGHGIRRVAIDGMVCSKAMADQLAKELKERGGMELVAAGDPFDTIWPERPPIPQEPVRRQSLELAGEAASLKLERIRKELRALNADGMLMATLDDIAWTLNLRGGDVHCNPVFVSYLLVDNNRATLYINKDKLSADICDYLRKEGIDVDDYENVATGIAGFSGENILMDPDQTAQKLYDFAKVNVVETASPVPMMKAVKNDCEIRAFHEAMARDGVAMTKFLIWLEKSMAEGERLTELTVSHKLEQLRAEQCGFRGLSFDTIAAYQEHGAIVHYEPDEESDIPLKAEGLLLLDSGAQYDEGTTDITRTIPLGPLTDDQQRVFTLVLKGHLRLQNLHFPDGACGTQLDAIARQPLWEHGLNYLHGTGHGVGACLNVHEGPHQIRMEYRPAPLHAGMTVTDEPGIYLENRFGVRIENTLIVVDDRQTEFGRFLKFEPLTLCPIAVEPIVRSLMTDEEVHWLNRYHRRVFEVLSPRLSDDERTWLQQATRPLA